LKHFLLILVDLRKLLSVIELLLTAVWDSQVWVWNLTTVLSDAFLLEQSLEIWIASEKRWFLASILPVAVIVKYLILSCLWLLKNRVARWKIILRNSDILQLLNIGKFCAALDILRAILH
jgi:hypothetical protein